MSQISVLFSNKCLKDNATSFMFLFLHRCIVLFNFNSISEAPRNTALHMYLVDVERERTSTNLGRLYEMRRKRRLARTARKLKQGISYNLDVSSVWGPQSISG